MQPAEHAAVEHEGGQGAGTLDRVQLEQRDRVVARLDLPMDGAVEGGHRIGQQHGASVGHAHLDAVEAVVGRARQQTATAP